MADAGVEVVLLNFDAGDMPAGDRGVLSDPSREHEFHANIPVALALADAIGCRQLNALVGFGDLDLARAQRPPRRRRRARQDDPDRGRQHVRERPLPALEHPRARRSSCARTGRDNVRLQYDAYHMQRMEGNLLPTIAEHLDLIAPHPDRRRPRARRAGHRRDRLRLPAAEDRRARLHRLGRAGVQADPRHRRDPGLDGALVIGFIGLGVMGEPMARNLVAAGHDVLVHNRTPKTVDGARSVSLEEAASADVVITMLPDSAAVLAVADAIVEAAPGAVDRHVHDPPDGGDRARRSAASPRSTRRSPAATWAPSRARSRSWSAAPRATTSAPGRSWRPSAARSCTSAGPARARPSRPATRSWSR